jgi:hypothetical protein
MQIYDINQNNSKMKKNLVFLNFLALVASFFWAIKTNFDYEPIIVILTLIVTLIGLIKNKELPGFSNIAVIKGGNNKVNQSINGDKGVLSKENSASIDGEFNEITQNN